MGQDMQTELFTLIFLLDWEFFHIYFALKPVSFMWRAPAYNFVSLVSGWTREEAIDSLMRKAGYSGQIMEFERKQKETSNIPIISCDYSIGIWIKKDQRVCI